MGEGEGAAEGLTAVPGTVRAPLVVKLGGSTLAAQVEMLSDVAALARQGERLVVVHGGGAAVSAWMERLGLQPTFKNGLRVTDEATLEVVRMVLAGSVNQELVAVAAGLGARAVGLTGLDGRLLQARRLTSGGDIGFVGEIVEVQTGLLEALLDAGFLPIVAPLARATDGREGADPLIYNINADVAAGSIAAALRAAAAVFLTDVPGVRGREGTILEWVRSAQVEGLIAEGVISGGMIPKVQACLAALRGARHAVILDGRVPHSLRDWAAGGASGTIIEA